jgi:phage shock protein E
MKFKNLLLTIFIIITSVTGLHAQSAIGIKSAEANAMLKKDSKIVILDVRTADEFNAGHLKGAINIDIRQPDALSKIDKLDHKAKYIVHCRTNRRSQTAVDHMVKNGFKTVYQMMDGYAGWTENNLETKK